MDFNETKLKILSNNVKDQLLAGEKMVFSLKDPTEEEIVNLKFKVVNGEGLERFRDNIGLQNTLAFEVPKP